MKKCTMLTLSSHVIYMQFGEFKICSPFNKCEKKTMFGENQCSQKKQFTISSWKNLPDFHPNLCGFLDSPSIEVAGAVTPGASFTGSLKQLLFGGPEELFEWALPVSALNGEAPFGIHHLEWQKQHVCLFGMRLSEMDIHHPIFFTKKHRLKMSTFI